ncbi:four helix bundle protein [Pseudomonas frederiksbergensis]|uniref:Four helix bundle protein n=1 Tax=Pseudomonas frederiksbergensis TaxID=104087 RepID=A0A423KIF6_9PSED|nr:four helix bundle protein [Pseudomonas frederiksbergensis]RON52896.1 four helix bundle protein [Pseudomonas frederiksbergensis]
MGMHTELSIYKVSLGLLQMATNLTRNIPRDLKQSLGKRVIDECIDVLLLIARANSTRDKQPHLVLLVEKVQVVEFLMRLFKESRFISITQHATAIEVTTSIGKQANAWKRSTPTAPAT